MSWSAFFEDPIPLPGGRKLVTLEDAARYIQKLPKAQHSQRHWQDAVEHLMRASAWSAAWMMFASMFMLRALHYGRLEPEKEPRRKRTKAFKIIPALKKS